MSERTDEQPDLLEGRCRTAEPMPRHDWLKTLVAMFARLQEWQPSFRPSARQYALAFTTFAAVSLLNLWLQNWIGYQAIALVYLLAVVLLALFVGRGPILVGTALTALGWNFLFAPPRYSFHIGSFYDKMMFAMYFVVSLTVAQLTARLRAQRLEEQKREERATALYLLTRELADAAGLKDILGKVVHQTGKAFNAEVSLLFPDPNQPGRLVSFDAGTWTQNEPERAIAACAFERNQPAGRGTSISPQAEGLHLPLSAGGSPAGVIGLRLKSSAGLSLEQRNLLENFARQIALVLDRQRLRDAEVNTRLLAESERLGRTLLNSVSHELRTPLAAITSAANSLRASGPLASVQEKLATEIESASARLNRVVQSLLSAARVQSGQIRPNLEWCDVSDLCRVALRNTAGFLSSHPLENRLTMGLPLVKADSVLLEQALANLLVNAAIHTPRETRIEISARVEAKELILEVADRGPGLPPDQLERIFDLFYRVPAAKPGGTGLGLAIVKGFVEAQGGRVLAANRPGGGASFCICLPMSAPPHLPEEPL
jgi:two-component system sensor histidine kinase KdpD